MKLINKEGFFRSVLLHVATQTCKCRCISLPDPCWWVCTDQEDSAVEVNIYIFLCEII